MILFAQHICGYRMGIETRGKAQRVSGAAKETVARFAGCRCLGMPNYADSVPWMITSCLGTHLPGKNKRFGRIQITCLETDKAFDTVLSSCAKAFPNQRAARITSNR